METPKVCIIMPVYNGEKTIQLALNSLLAQTYKNWKCVIVNDGSTDGTKRILDSLTDERFKVIHLDKNCGRGAARQVCLENADGDYLCYLDADEFYHKVKIQYLIDNPSALERIATNATYITTKFSMKEICNKYYNFIFYNIKSQYEYIKCYKK